MFTLSWIFLCVIMMAMRWWCCFAASSVFVFLSFAYIVVLLLTMILLTLCSLMITMLNFFYMRKLFDFPTILHYWGVKKRIELFVWRICAYIQSFAVIHWRIAKHSWAHNRTHKIGRKNTTKRICQFFFFPSFPIVTISNDGNDDDNDNQQRNAKNT